MIHVARIDDVWPRIAKAVEEMLGPAEVDAMLAACRFGSAMVIAADDAVAVLALRQPADDVELLVWAAVGHGFGLTMKYLPAVQHVAREVGAHRITFSPRRRGWPRLLRQLGSDWRMRPDGMFVMEV